MRRIPVLFLFSLLVLPLPIFAQATVTITPSITSGDGSFTIPTLSWATNPALTTGTPCTASATPAHPSWTGAKAGSGSVTNLGPFTMDTRLQLVCTFQGDSIVTYTWTNPTQNTNGTAYTNPDIIRIKHTFNSTLTTNPQVAASGETHTDVSQTPTPITTRTVTGISSTGTLRAAAFARNTQGVWSAASNTATKVFTGSFQVTSGVDITVRPVPNAPTNFANE